MADVDREAWGSISRIARNQPELVAETLELVAEQGPIRARDTGAVRPPPRPGHMWNWHEGKVALENLFFTGRVGAARRINFERQYDTIERILPPEILEQPTPAPEDAQRELVRIAAVRSGWPPSPTSAITSVCRAQRRRRASPSWSLPGSSLPVEVNGWAAEHTCGPMPAGRAV